MGDLVRIVGCVGRGIAYTGFYISVCALMGKGCEMAVHEIKFEEWAGRSRTENGYGERRHWKEVFDKVYGYDKYDKDWVSRNLWYCGGGVAFGGLVAGAMGLISWSIYREKERKRAEEMRREAYRNHSPPVQNIDSTKFMMRVPKHH